MFFLKGILSDCTGCHNVKLASMVGEKRGRGGGAFLFVTQISANDESGLFGSFALTFMWVCKLTPAGLMLEVREETAQLKGTLLSVKQLPSAIYSIHEDDVLWGSGSELKILNYKQMANVP